MGVQPPGTANTPLYYSFPMPKAVQQLAALRNAKKLSRPRSYDFDFNKGDFRTGGDGKVAKADGRLALVQRVVKTVLTERFAYLAYSRSFGTQIEAALLSPFRSVNETDIQISIRQALTWSVPDVTVSDFTFNWQTDNLYLGFNITDTLSPTPNNISRVQVHL